MSDTNFYVTCRKFYIIDKTTIAFLFFSVANHMQGIWKFMSDIFTACNLKSCSLSWPSIDDERNATSHVASSNLWKPNYNILILRFISIYGIVKYKYRAGYIITPCTSRLCCLKYNQKIVDNTSFSLVFVF